MMMYQENTHNTDFLKAKEKGKDEEEEEERAGIT